MQGGLSEGWGAANGHGRARRGSGSGRHQASPAAPPGAGGGSLLAHLPMLWRGGQAHQAASPGKGLAGAEEEPHAEHERAALLALGAPRSSHPLRRQGASSDLVQAHGERASGAPRQGTSWWFGGGGGGKASAQRPLARRSAPLSTRRSGGAAAAHHPGKAPAAAADKAMGEDVAGAAAMARAGGKAPVPGGSEDDEEAGGVDVEAGEGGALGSEAGSGLDEEEQEEEEEEGEELEPPHRTFLGTLLSLPWEVRGRGRVG